MITTTVSTVPSLAKFADFVQLKDYRQPTKDEYVRYVRKLGEHYACDPATLTQDQVRALIHSPPGSLTPAGLLPSVEVLSRLPKPLKSSCSCAKRNSSAARP